MTYGFAKALDDMIRAIVDGGFLDDLSDSAIRGMADRIADNEVRAWEELGDKWFTVRFCDGSEIIFQQLD